MKADLWDHIINVIWEVPQQIQIYSGKTPNELCEIVDIQFAMNDQKHLEPVIKIQDLALKLEKLEKALE
jgi:hypothetical protein